MRNRVKLCIVVISVLLYSGALQAADRAVPDARLSKRVTMDCANVRLYQVLDRLSTETGIAISAGRSKSDWRVRDMPVLMCARDLPIDKLLRSIADSTHLLLSRYRSGDTWTYRIWRDVKRGKEIEAFEQARDAAAHAAASYDWDTLSELKDLPEEAFTGDPEWSNWRNEERAVSRALSELGPDMRNSILMGETIMIGMDNAPESVKPHLMEGFQSFQQMAEDMAARNGTPAPTRLQDGLNRCHVRLSFGRQGEYPSGLSAELWGADGYKTINADDYQTWMRKYRPDMPLRPVVPDPALELDALAPPYARLPIPDRGGPDFLDVETSLHATQKGPRPRYADILAQVSMATGYSIIAEGSAARYRTRVYSLTKDREAMAGREFTAREALKFGTGLNRMDWYLDEQNKLIVGRDKEWVEGLKALVPEKLLMALQDKLDGSGIELDDLEALVGLSPAQCREWIVSCPEFPAVEALAVEAINVSGRSIWALYFALTKAERLQALAGRRVSLAGCDPAIVGGIIRQHIAGEREHAYLLNKPAPSVITDTDTFSDPDALPPLWMQVARRDLDAYGKRMYSISVTGDAGSGPQTLQQTMSSLFPIQSVAQTDMPAEGHAK